MLCDIYTVQTICQLDVLARFSVSALQYTYSTVQTTILVRSPARRLCGFLHKRSPLACLVGVIIYSLGSQIMPDVRALCLGPVNVTMLPYVSSRYTVRPHASSGISSLDIQAKSKSSGVTSEVKEQGLIIWTSVGGASLDANCRNGNGHSNSVYLRSG